MKTKFTIIFLSIITLSIAQVKVVTVEKLPGYSFKDSLYTQTEVWVQSYKEELKQREEALKSERKIDGLRHILKSKKAFEPIIDSLLTEIRIVTHERDSLNDALNKGMINLSVSMIETIDAYELDLWTLKNHLDDAKSAQRYWRRLFWGGVTVFVLENGIILLLL